MSNPLQETPSKIKESLKRMLDRYGKTICLDHQKTHQLLLNEYPDRPPELVALWLASKVGVASDINQNGSGVLSAIMADRFTQRLITQGGLHQELAEYAVHTWVHAIGISAQAKTYAPPPSVQSISQKTQPPIRQPKDKPYPMNGHRRALTDIVFSPNGRWIATSSIDRSVRVWDGRSGTCKGRLFGGHRDWVRCLKYRPDGERLASGGDDGAARIWNMTNGNRLHRLAGHQGFVRQLAYSADGHLLATVGTDGMICIWQADIMQCLERIGPIANDISDIAFDPKGQLLAAACPNRIRIYSMTTHKEVHQLSAIGDRCCITFDDDGDLFIGDQDGVRKVSLHSGQTRYRFGGIRGGARRICIDPVGPSLICAGADQSIRIWDTRDEEPLWKHDFAKIITGVSVNKAGTIAVAFGDGKALLWEMARGR